MKTNSLTQYFLLAVTVLTLGGLLWFQVGQRNNSIGNVEAATNGDELPIEELDVAPAESTITIDPPEVLVFENHGEIDGHH